MVESVWYKCAHGQMQQVDSAKCNYHLCNTYTLHLKHGVESTNLKAATEARVCSRRHDHTFSAHKSHEQHDYTDDTTEKTSPYSMKDPTQKVHSLSGT